MVESREAGPRKPSPGACSGAPASVELSGQPRAIMLECRIERLLSGLDSARAEADRAREQLAGAMARQVELSGRCHELEAELAEARAEVLVLHRRLDQGESLRGELEGHLMAGGSAGREELRELRRALHEAEQRAAVHERVATELRERLEEVLASRERLFARVAEWQRSVSDDLVEAVDLAELIADLRGEVLALERRCRDANGRELLLRLSRGGDEQGADSHLVRCENGVAGGGGSRAEDGEAVGLAFDERPDRAVEGGGESEEPTSASRGSLEARSSGAASGRGVPEVSLEGNARASGPDARSGEQGGVGASSRRARRPRGEAPSSAPRAIEAIADSLGGANSEARAEMLVMLGRRCDEAAIGVVRPWLRTLDSTVRAAAYSAMIRLLEHRGEELGECVRAGLSDGEPRVRRRVVLAAAASRRLPPETLLPLADDPDEQTRRMIRRLVGVGRAAARAVTGEGAEEVEPASATARVVPSRT